MIAVALRAESGDQPSRQNRTNSRQRVYDREIRMLPSQGFDLLVIGENRITYRAHDPHQGQHRGRTRTGYRRIVGRGWLPIWSSVSNIGTRSPPMMALTAKLSARRFCLLRLSCGH